jgi:nucleoside-triphosphatase THEP1
MSAGVKWGNSLVIHEPETPVHDLQTSLWYQLLQPTCINECFGNTLQQIQLREVFAAKTGHIFVHGPSGVGKTLMVKLLAKEAGYHVVEAANDESRTGSCIDTFVSNTISRGNGILLVDDFESIFVESTGVSALSKHMRTKALPIRMVFIANIVRPEFSVIVNKCSSNIEFICPTITEMCQGVMQMLSKTVLRTVHVPPMDVYTICEAANGDIRHMYQLLQFSYSHTKKPTKVQKPTRCSKAAIVASHRKDTTSLANLHPKLYIQSLVKNVSTSSAGCITPLGNLSYNSLEIMECELFDTGISGAVDINEACRMCNALSLSDIMKLDLFLDDRDTVIDQDTPEDCFSYSEMPYVYAIGTCIKELQSRTAPGKTKKRPGRTLAFVAEKRRNAMPSEEVKMLYLNG